VKEKRYAKNVYLLVWYLDVGFTAHRSGHYPGFCHRATLPLVTCRKL
jgi:hypothetical protein